MKKVKAKAKKKIVKNGLKIVNLKVNGKDRKAINALAKKYAKGNLSAWLRHAGLRYAPKKSEVVSTKPYK
jgi:hypothetical protein